LAATAFFFTGFLPVVGLLRLPAFLGDFFGDDVFLITLDFFPADFFGDVEMRDAPFLREAAALARFLLAAFLAAIVHSCPSEKNAELYIDCAHMEAQKQGFFALFQAACISGPAAAQTGSSKELRTHLVEPARLSRLNVNRAGHFNRFIE
jgi:hypothetical protein